MTIAVHDADPRGTEFRPADTGPRGTEFRPAEPEAMGSVSGTYDLAPVDPEPQASGRTPAGRTPAVTEPQASGPQASGWGAGGGSRARGVTGAAWT
jgi:hypothetical protein